MKVSAQSTTGHGQIWHVHQVREEKEHREAKLVQNKQLLTELCEKIELLQSMIGHDEQEKKALRAENVLLVSDNVELQGQLHEQQALSVRLQETVDDLQKQIIEIKCTGCAYRSARRGNLKMHMLTHTGKKPYKCTICGYRAIHAGHLNQHMRTHTGEKPFKCTSCGYRAVQASNLKQHMRTHTGEKPFKCTICGYRAVQASNLKRHMRTHTGPFKIAALLQASSAIGHTEVASQSSRPHRHFGPNFKYNIADGI